MRVLCLFLCLLCSLSIRVTHKFTFTNLNPTDENTLSILRRRITYHPQNKYSEFLETFIAFQFIQNASLSHQKTYYESLKENSYSLSSSLQEIATLIDVKTSLPLTSPEFTYRDVSHTQMMKHLISIFPEIKHYIHLSKARAEMAKREENMYKIIIANICDNLLENGINLNTAASAVKTLETYINYPILPDNHYQKLDIPGDKFRLSSHTHCYSLVHSIHRMAYEYFHRNDVSAYLNAQSNIVRLLRDPTCNDDKLRVAGITLARLFQRVVEEGYEAVVAASTDLEPLELEFLGSFTTKVPKIVHFLKTDFNTTNFGLLQYLAIRAAYERIKPLEIQYHTVIEPETEFWEMAKPYVTLLLETPPQTFNGLPFRYAAVQADVWRMQILYETGGIYLDWDVIPLQAFDALLHSPVTIASGGVMAIFTERVVFGTLIAKPKSRFIKRWLEIAPRYYVPGEYGGIAIDLVEEMASLYPDEVHIVPETYFVPEKPSPQGFKRLFTTNATLFPLSESYAMELFQSNPNYSAFKHLVTMENINNRDTVFTRNVRDLLPTHCPPVKFTA